LGSWGQGPWARVSGRFWLKRGSRYVEKGKLSPEEKEESLKRIRPTTKLEELRDAGLIIEAVVENVRTKAGRFGLKAGKGIYVAGKADAEFFEITQGIQRETGLKNTEFSVERLVLRQVNEAVYCLQEKIATAEDIDRAMVLGTGFPANEKGRGGPLHWADQMGLDWVLERLKHFQKTLGARFLPHFLMNQYVAAGYLGEKVKKGFFEY
jgi:3-hydroxyacyl-CoA dehydrogenase